MLFINLWVHSQLWNRKPQQRGKTVTEAHVKLQLAFSRKTGGIKVTRSLTFAPFGALNLQVLQHAPSCSFAAAVGSWCCGRTGTPNPQEAQGLRVSVLLQLDVCDRAAAAFEHDSQPRAGWPHPV